MGSRKRNSKKKAPESRWQSLLKKPWIFAGAAFGLDLAMLIAGMVLSAAKLPVDYTASGDSIVHSQPLAFFGVTAAVVVALLCVLIGLIIGGAFLKKRRAAQITGAAGLLIVSLAMVGSSAFMALGSPVRERYSVSYSDEELRLKDNWSQLDRIYTTLSYAYDVRPWFKAAAFYALIANDRGADRSMEMRHRFYLTLNLDEEHRIVPQNAHLFVASGAARPTGSGGHARRRDRCRPRPEQHHKQYARDDRGAGYRNPLPAAQLHTDTGRTRSCLLHAGQIQVLQIGFQLIKFHRVFIK